MRRTLNLLLIVLFTLTGCYGQKSPRGSGNVNSMEVSNTIITLSEKFRKYQGLHLEDSVIYHDNRITSIRLDYSSMDSIDLWEARALLVDVVEEFLTEINNNANITPYLKNYPLTPNNIEVNIRFVSFYTLFIDLEMIGLITLRNGISNYYAADALDCDIDCWHKRSEYYSQSRSFIDSKRYAEELYPIEEISEGRPSAFDDERHFSNENQ